MTGQPHTTVASAVITYGFYAGIVIGLLLLALLAELRDRKELRDRAAAKEAERLRAMRQAAEDAAVVHTAVVHGPQRLPSYRTCELIWAETLTWEEPDRDLLAEWDRFGKEHA